MRITKFRWDDNYTVEFITDRGDEFKIVTADMPGNELFSKLVEYTCVAENYFNAAKNGIFYSISITTGDHPTSRLEVEIPLDTHEYARVKFPAVEFKIIQDATGGIDRHNPRNIYNAYLGAFIEEIKAYAAGKRAQKELLFDEVEETEDTDRVLEFNR
jgi:hypothetical protein